MYHRYMDPHTQPFNPQVPPNSYPCQYYTSNHPSGFVHHPYPNHAEHSGCCNYSHPPGYYGIGPQYTCMQPSPPLHYHAPYPPHPYAYPAYSVPPPHYSLDQPRYDYDKTKHHCCGCPNHTCSEKDDKPDSSNLIRAPNYPFPVFWVPPEYTKDKENSNGWVPLDMNSLKGMRQEDEEKKQPISPIIWMPGFDKPMEAVKEVKDNDPNVEDWPSKFKIFPLKLLENKDGDKKSSTEKDVMRAPKEKENRIKILPLKLVENEDGDKKLVENEDGDKKSAAVEDAAKAPKEKESRIKIVPVKHLEESSEKKTSMPEKPKDACEAKAAPDKKQTTCKSSKLPPVCLRVDPLPRRKAANGTSRSSSPPGAKGERVCQQDEGQISMVSANGIAKERDIPVTAVKDKPSTQEEKEQNCNSNKTNLQAKHKVVDTTEDAVIGHKHVEGNRPEGRSMEGKKERKALSESDAAVVIQSAYRGFEVRRWQPLDKLRKIAKIREQTAKIRGQIETFNEGKDSKQRIVIGETIMNLLLQLDTIQGLHPSVREARKTVARELVCLQEKLDALSSQGVEDHESVKVSDPALSEIKQESLEEMAASVVHVDTKEPAKVEDSNTKQESLEEMTASVDHVDAEEPENVEDNVNAMSTDVETKPTLDQELKQLAEVNSDADRVNDITESSISSGDEVAATASPSLATLPVPEKELSMSYGDEVATIASPDLETAPMLEKVSSPSLATLPMPGKESIMSSDDGVATIASPDPATVSVLEEVSSMSSANEVPGIASPSLMLSDNEVAIIASPSLETSPMSEERMDNMGDGNNVTVADRKTQAVETTANVDESSLSSIGAPMEGPISNEPEKQQEPTDVLGTIPDVSEHCQEHEVPKEEVVDSGALDDTNVVCEVKKLRVQPVEEKTHAIAVEEDKINYEMDNNSLEVQKDDNAEEEIQALPVTDQNCHIEMSAEVEDIAGMGIDSSSPKHDVECRSHVSTVEEDPNMSAASDHVATMDEAEAQPVREKAVNDIPVGVIEEEKKLIEENGKLREMLEKLLEVGKEQLGVISDLNGRVKDLERKLAQKKRMKVKHNKRNQRAINKNISNQ